MKRVRAVDALVIGGGFYGCAIAAWLKRQAGLARVLVVEREPELLSRATWANQARIHNGYHYPRSYLTAWRSRRNYARFMDLYRDCVADAFETVYCIARRNSFVTATQFQRFCADIGGYCKPASRRLSRLFDPRMIEAAFLVRESVFDATRLRARMRQELDDAGVAVMTGTTVTRVLPDPSGGTTEVVLAGAAERLHCRRVYNCTYAGLRQFDLPTAGAEVALRYEVAELALVEVPPELERLGVTVMDGPFFSIMPFPARGLHSLSHVRYTPHFAWTSKDQPRALPYDVLDAYDKPSRAGYMIRDAARYMPCVGRCVWRQSIFELKTLLLMSETNDGRPIFFETHSNAPGVHSVLGGKMDNIFDVLETLSQEQQAYV